MRHTEYMATTVEEKDIILVRRVLTGDKSAFRSLVERYQNYVFSIAVSITKNREEAEEVAQDVFIKVYKQLGSFQQRSQLSTWLYTITYRTGLDYVRRKRLHTEPIEREDGQAIPLADDLEAGPSGQLQQSDLQDLLAGALEQLEAADAALLQLYYFKERSVREITDITGLSASNVKTRLFRLRNQLKEVLSQKLNQEIEDLL